MITRRQLPAFVAALALQSYTPTSGRAVAPPPVLTDEEQNYAIAELRAMDNVLLWVLQQHGKQISRIQVYLRNELPGPDLYTDEMGDA